eukprot:scaffold13180_cov33-Prasinocladus_malaysianus.AAC.1
MIASCAVPLARGLPTLKIASAARSQRRASRAVRVVASAQDEEQQSWISKAAVPFAGVLAAAMMLTAAVPDEALAARSGGRVGG